jgi:hypothetical protein
MRLVRPGRLFLIAVLSVFAVVSGGMSALLATCGPFTDTANDAFCPFVLEVFYTGITSGTTATTYDPTSNVTRLQMAAFLARTVDAALKRGSRRAAMDRFWNGQQAGLTTIGTGPQLVAADGADVWAANFGSSSVSRVRASDGMLLETWTGASSAYGVIAAMGKILVTGASSPGNLYLIDPSQTAGAVTTVASTLGNTPNGLVFDGARIWTANLGNSVSIVTPGSIPWTVTTVTTGFGHLPGAVFDGSNVWVTVQDAGTILKLDSGGAILQTVTVGAGPSFPLYDGSNIWVPNQNGNSVTVIRPATGSVLTTLTGNGLNGPTAAAFDGQRVLVTNNAGTGGFSIFKAADLTPVTNLVFGAAAGPFGVCSDGIDFWIAANTLNVLARF